MKIDPSGKIKRLDCQRFCRVCLVGDLRRPETPPPRVSDLWTPYAGGTMLALSVNLSVKALKEQ
jgi:hypothetical protein